MGEGLPPPHSGGGSEDPSLQFAFFRYSFIAHTNYFSTFITSFHDPRKHAYCKVHTYMQLFGNHEDFCHYLSSVRKGSKILSFWCFDPNGCGVIFAGYTNAKKKVVMLIKIVFITIFKTTSNLHHHLLFKF